MNPCSITAQLPPQPRREDRRKVCPFGEQLLRRIAFVTKAKIRETKRNGPNLSVPNPTRRRWQGIPWPAISRGGLTRTTQPPPPFSVASRALSSSQRGCPFLFFIHCQPLLAHANHLTMALVMRIKFPPTYPLIYKTLRIDSKLTANEAIHFISETLNVAIQGNVGLYIPQEHMWLDPNTPLSQYDTLHEVVRPPPPQTKSLSLLLQARLVVR